MNGISVQLGCKYSSHPQWLQQWSLYYRLNMLYRKSFNMKILLQSSLKHCSAFGCTVSNFYYFWPSVLESYIYTHTHTHGPLLWKHLVKNPAPLLIMLPWLPSQNSPFLARPSLVLVSHNLQGKPQFNPSDILHSSLFPLFLVDVLEKLYQITRFWSEEPWDNNLWNTVFIATAKVNKHFC